MPDILLRPAEDPIALSPQAAARLLDRGDGDAALLYLALLRRREGTSPRSLAGELRWDRARIEGAEAVLRELGLLAPAPQAAPEPACEPPVYQQEEIAEALEADGEFSRLTAEVERRLGKKLSTAGLSTLLGLYDDCRLPADVIYLLVCHCVQRAEERFGPGRRPAMSQIEKEGYLWARLGIVSQEAAAAHLRKYAESWQALPAYMRALRLGDRPPAAGEEKYLLQWREWGFGPEAAALAYDKTVLRCHEFKWSYCNGILRRWHGAGLHTPEEIERQDARPAAKTQTATPGASGKDDGNAWMRKYIQRRKEEG